MCRLRLRRRPTAESHQNKSAVGAQPVYKWVLKLRVSHLLWGDSPTFFSSQSYHTAPISPSASQPSFPHFTSLWDLILLSITLLSLCVSEVRVVLCLSFSKFYCFLCRMVVSIDTFDIIYLSSLDVQFLSMNYCAVCPFCFRPLLFDPYQCYTELSNAVFLTSLVILICCLVLLYSFQSTW